MAYRVYSGTGADCHGIDGKPPASGGGGIGSETASAAGRSIATPGAGNIVVMVGKAGGGIGDATSSRPSGAMTAEASAGSRARAVTSLMKVTSAGVAGRTPTAAATLLTEYDAKGGLIRFGAIGSEKLAIE